MAQDTSQSAEALLSSVLQADRALRDAQEGFLTGGDERAQVSAIGKQVDAMWNDIDHGPGSLICMAELLAQIAGAQACKLLVKMLGYEEPNVRAASGEALVDLGYDRYAEVARAIEVEVDKGTDEIALCEVPFLLAELGEAGGVKICAKLLKHKDADVVGAAIEGLAQLGDPSAIREIEPLKGDKRTLTMDEDSESGEVTVGDLAAEALSHLRTIAG